MLRRGGAAIVGASAAAATYKYCTDPGFERAVRLYTSLGPVVVHYRCIEFRQRWLASSPANAEAEWQALDRRYAASSVRTLESLQGMYTKYGQIGAGMTNTFSHIWIEELRKLEDKVPPRSAEVVMQTIAEETGKEVSATFSYFDPEPLGSASIGQVHRAVLASDGTEVAVKVQYPVRCRLSIPTTTGPSPSARLPAGCAHPEVVGSRPATAGGAPLFSH